MRRVVASGVAALVLLPGSVVQAAPQATPHIRVVTSKPFVVVGTRFKRREIVRVVIQFKGKHVRTVKAGKAGRFTARFLRLAVRTCDGYIVRATGNKGSRAYTRRISECIGG